MPRFTVGSLAFAPSFGVVAAVCAVLFCGSVRGERWISETPLPDGFPLVAADAGATIVYSEEDFAVVGLAVEDFIADVERVTGRRPERSEARSPGRWPLYVGTLGRSEVVDRLAAEGRIDVSELRGAWESFLIATVDDPQPGVERGLVVVGSDRRGTAFGVYELSREIGVSPWYWWADVPPRKSEQLWVASGTRRFGPPSVKYRGIFINDEDWGLHPWASKTFDPELGDIGPKTYEKVFELMLRLKANTLWPAMHEVTKAFNLYPENKTLADRYGIVMASSHAEPLLRNNVTEWMAPKSEYNYHTNRDGVLRYWEQRLEENGAYENVYTLGMRGIHDSGITVGDTVEEKAAFLNRIIADQRSLLREHVNPELASVPQVFTPYKEVLELYRSGLELPDEVTIVWPDDNHGFIRRFPNEEERERSGGSGVYYHLSYLGSPMAYLWLYTTPPALVWEEMSKAYALGAQDYWIVNVGDIKPGELGMDLFLQMAWNVYHWNLDTIGSFLPTWAGEVFGEENGGPIGSLLATYFELNYQRRPEHLQWWLPHQRVKSSPLTGRETRERLERFRELVAACEAAKAELAPALRDAYFQLVEYPVKASAFANQRYFHAEQYGRLFNADPGAAAIHGALARRAEEALRVVTKQYNQEVSDGKWNRMMAVEPADNMWRSYRLTPPILPEENMVVELDSRGAWPAELAFSGDEASRHAEVEREAEAFDRSGAAGEASWRVIPGLGRTGDSIAGFPVTASGLEGDELREKASWVEYDFTLSQSGKYMFYVNVIPTFPIEEGRGLRIGVGLGEGDPQMVTLLRETGDDAWKEGVLAGSLTLKTELAVASGGPQRLRLYLVDPGVVVDTWFLSSEPLAPRFLGPEAD